MHVPQWKGGEKGRHPEYGPLPSPWLRSYNNVPVALAALGQTFSGIGLAIMCCRLERTRPSPPCHERQHVASAQPLPSSALYFVVRPHRMFITVVAFLTWLCAGASVLALSFLRDPDSALFKFFFILCVLPLPLPPRSLDPTCLPPHHLTPGSGRPSASSSSSLSSSSSTRTTSRRRPHRRRPPSTRRTRA